MIYISDKFTVMFYSCQLAKSLYAVSCQRLRRLDFRTRQTHAKPDRQPVQGNKGPPGDGRNNVMSLHEILSKVNLLFLVGNAILKIYFIGIHA
jgi:hypothetical protein